MTTPRRRHLVSRHDKSRSPTYSSHLLSGKHLRRRTTSSSSSAPFLSPRTLDILIQTSCLFLLSGLAIGIVMVIGKFLSFLEQHLNPIVEPELRSVQLPTTPLPLSFKDKDRFWGNLKYNSLQQQSRLPFQRMISRQDAYEYEQQRAALLKEESITTTTSNMMMYDEVGGGLGLAGGGGGVGDDGDPDLDISRGDCERIQTRHVRPRFYSTCNSFHELLPLDRDEKDITQRYDERFLGWHGSISPYGFWLVTSNDKTFFHDSNDFFVLKQRGLNEKGLIVPPDAPSLRQSQMDAIISEHLTTSPRIVHIYGHCGLSMLAEYMPKDVFEHSEEVKKGDSSASSSSFSSTTSAILDRAAAGIGIGTGAGAGTGAGGLVSKKYRQYTATEMLGMVILMAEAVADLHGFEGGVLVHTDLKLSRFRLNPRGQIKLSGFGNAKIILRNNNLLEDGNNQQKKKKVHCQVHGQRPAEETLTSTPIDEQVDLAGLGDSIFNLLTGTNPADSNGISPDAYESLRDRGFIEGKLVELVENLWSDNPRSVVEVVTFLQEVKRASLQ